MTPSVAGVEMRGGKRRAVGSALVLPLALALLPHTSLGFHALPQAWSPPGLRLGACSAGRAALGSGAVVCSLGGAGGRGGKGVFARRKDTRADMAPHVRSWGRGEGAGKAGRGKGGLKAGEAPTGEAEQEACVYRKGN
ncbi:hypothetical protein T484DRAFT_1843309 [Baffinella frigidus]|nr:hypothetical protein T484DRAFT_1843309 [Cryptophyta sp. CCMP2293]